MGEALAILAAVLFALGTVLQQRGTLSTTATGDGSSKRRHSTADRLSWSSPSTR